MGCALNLQPSACCCQRLCFLLYRDAPQEKKSFTPHSRELFRLFHRTQSRVQSVIPTNCSQSLGSAIFCCCGVLDHTIAALHMIFYVEDVCLIGYAHCHRSLSHPHTIRRHMHRYLVVNGIGAFLRTHLRERWIATLTFFCIYLFLISFLLAAYLGGLRHRGCDCIFGKLPDCSRKTSPTRVPSIGHACAVCCQKC